MRDQITILEVFPFILDSEKQDQEALLKAWWWTYLLGADRLRRWHTAAWQPHHNGPWTGPKGRQPGDVPLDIAGSGYSGWPTGRQSSGACQSVGNDPYRWAASAPAEMKRNNNEGGLHGGERGGIGKSSRNRGAGSPVENPQGVNIHDKRRATHVSRWPS